ncbi:hypothetical protein Unana1_04658 [Umbelopsis nana]
MTSPTSIPTTSNQSPQQTTPAQNTPTPVPSASSNNHGTPTPSSATTTSDDNSNSGNNNDGRHSSQDGVLSSSPVATSYQITVPASTVIAWSTNEAGQVFSSQSVIPPTVSVVVSTIYSASSSTASPASADTQSTSSPPSPGVIIGSVCAFLAILIAGGVYAFFWKTRRPSNRQKARLYGGEQGNIDDEASSNMLEDDRPQYRTGPAPYYSYAQDAPLVPNAADMSELRLSMPPRGYVSPELSSQRMPILQRPNEK